MAIIIEVNGPDLPRLKDEPSIGELASTLPGTAEQAREIASLLLSKYWILPR